MARPSEDEIIARYLAPLAGEGALGFRDDAACMGVRPGIDLVVTTDTLVENVHFRAGDPPASIAWKALAVNISDLAAKGAEPRSYLLNLTLPRDWNEEWLAAFTHGLAVAGRTFGCELLGGDTVGTDGPLTLSVTALGEVPSGRMVRRTNAQVGDVIGVTGSIGDSALGLDLGRPNAWSGGLPDTEREHLADRYLHPQPRHRLAAALRAHVHAAMDVSDGLAGDLAKMMRVSGTSALVEIDRVPLSPAARRVVGAVPDMIDRVMTGGDDYEVLFTLPGAGVDTLRDLADRVNIPVTIIGQVVAGDAAPVFRQGEAERPYHVGSYSHF